MKPLGQCLLTRCTGPGRICRIAVSLVQSEKRAPFLMKPLELPGQREKFSLTEFILIRTVGHRRFLWKHWGAVRPWRRCRMRKHGRFKQYSALPSRQLVLLAYLVYVTGRGSSHCCSSSTALVIWSSLRAAWDTCLRCPDHGWVPPTVGAEARLARFLV